MVGDNPGDMRGRGTGSRWKPGQSGNPKGRPRKTAMPLAQRISAILDAPMKYHENGQTKVAPRRELSLRMLVDRAAKGDLAAAADILKVRREAERRGGGRTNIRVENWLPDHVGQTAEEKSDLVVTGAYAEPGKREE
jgi:Family of unknown function (DUF5681)